MTEKTPKNMGNIFKKSCRNVSRSSGDEGQSVDKVVLTAGRCIIIKQLITLSSTQPASVVYWDSLADTLISMTSKEIDPVSDLSWTFNSSELSRFTLFVFLRFWKTSRKATNSTDRPLGHVVYRQWQIRRTSALWCWAWSLGGVLALRLYWRQRNIICQTGCLANKKILSCLHSVMCWFMCSCLSYCCHPLTLEQGCQSHVNSGATSSPV